MSVRSRFAALSGLLAISTLLVAASGRADVAWRVADEGPRAPEAVQILGDETRTLAFGPSGDWELRGTTWHPVPLRTTEIVGSKRTLFFANGRFGATTSRSSDCQVQLFILSGDTWTRLWSETSCHPVVRSEERLYVVAEAFRTCGCASDPSLGPEARRLRSVSLADGSVREEAPLPACSGTLFALSGKLHLIGTPPICGGPSSDDVAALVSTPPYPFYRLDEAGWTQLPPWDLPVWTFFESTPNSLWVVYALGGVDYVARILTTTGFSDPVPVPRDITVSSGGPKPLEWNGRLLATSREGRGNIYLLEGNALVRMTPVSPVTARYPAPLVSVAGNRIFTSADGWDVHVRDGSEWIATTGVVGAAGADSYLSGETKTFAVRGSRLYRREDAGWKRLPPSPSAEQAEVIGVWKDRPVVAEWVSSSISRRHLVLDGEPEEWVDLKSPEGFDAPMLGVGQDLHLSGPAGRLARLRDGVWAILEASPLPSERCTSRPVAIRRVGGETYGVATDSCSGPDRRDEAVFRVDGDRLVRAFPDLDRAMHVRDVLEVDGEPVLQVHDASPGIGPWAVLVRSTEAGFETLLTRDDVQESGRDSFARAEMSSSGSSVFFSGLRFARGRLSRQGGGTVPAKIDPDGRIAYGDRYRFASDVRPDPLLALVPRVRKQIAAVVDATGHGGTRYRSELTVANLSPGAACVAKVYSGAATEPSLEVPLEPGAQKRIADPVPGFVGPLAVEFDGLSDDREAWAAVRVFSASGGGTAGTSILGSEAGSLAGATTLLRPTRTPGSRLHLALATSRDGSDVPTWVYADARQAPEINAGSPLPAGSFLQVDPDPSKLFGPLRIEASTLWLSPIDDARNDLLGYFVRNDGATNDGTVVPFEEPDALWGRRTRFLPAVVGVTSEHGRYRTELTLGRRERWGLPEKGLTFTVTYRDEKGASTIPISVGLDGIVEVPDAGEWLAANGVPIDPTNFEGTLTFSSDRPEGAADLLVTALVQARVAGAAGDYGVSVPVVNEVRWADERAVVAGLREDAGFRSNVAVANPEPEGGPVVTLEVTLHQASDGSVIGILPQVTLPPGRRFQWNRPLSQIGYGGDAWAEVRRAGGSGRFVAYGVVNDNATSDGTLLPMTAVR
jgi:hypothetical protein